MISRKKKQFPGRLLFERTWTGAEVRDPDRACKVGGQTYHFQIRFVEERMTFVAVVVESPDIRVEGADVRAVQQDLLAKLKTIGMSKIEDRLWVRFDPDELFNVHSENGLRISHIQVATTTSEGANTYRISMNGSWGAWRAGAPQVGYSNYKGVELIGFLAPYNRARSLKATAERFRLKLQKFKTHLGKCVIAAMKDENTLEKLDFTSIVKSFGV